MGAMALHAYSNTELKRRSFTSKEPHVAREPQVVDPWSKAWTVFARADDGTVVSNPTEGMDV
jgi:hypothetical protein